jgi:hypothetical protein
MASRLTRPFSDVRLDAGTTNGRLEKRMARKLMKGTDINKKSRKITRAPRSSPRIKKMSQNDDQLGGIGGNSGNFHKQASFVLNRDGVISPLRQSGLSADRPAYSGSAFRGLPGSGSPRRGLHAGEKDDIPFRGRIQDTNINS